MYLNQKQKENLAQFYSNFALVWITAGLVSPLLTKIGNPVIFAVKLIISLFLTLFFLNYSLKFIKRYLIFIGI